MFLNNLYPLFVLLFLLVACKKEAPTNDSATISTTTIAKPTVSTPYPITNNSFHSISPGMVITDIPESIIRKGLFSSGEGTFDIYEIRSEEGRKLGHFYKNSQDETKVGTITITNREAKTAQGIGINSTYEEIRAALPNFEIHGSEIESRTHVTADGISYRLDFPSNQYELDKDAVPLTAKVLGINIGGSYSPSH